MLYLLQKSLHCYVNDYAKFQQKVGKGNIAANRVTSADQSIGFTKDLTCLTWRHFVAFVDNFKQEVHSLLGMFPITLNSLSISGKKQYVWCIYISALSAWKQIKVISKSYHYINIVNLFLYRESNYKTASDFKRMFMQDVRFKCININIIPLITRSDIF